MLYIYRAVSNKEKLSNLLGATDESSESALIPSEDSSRGRLPGADPVVTSDASSDIM